MADRRDESSPEALDASAAGPPRGHWLWGSLRDYNTDPLGFTERMGRLGGVVPMRLGPLRAVLISSPGLIQNVLVEQHRSFHKARGVRRLRTLLGEGILLSEGEHWLRHRRLMQPAFHRASVTRYSETMVHRTDQAVDRWLAAGVIDIVAEARRLTLEIAVETLFGNDIREHEARSMGEDLDTAGGQLQTRTSSLLMFVPDWVPTPGNRRMNAAIERIDRLVLRLIAERRASGEARTDLLGLLLGSPEGGEGLTDQELRDEAVTLLIAGHETTALTLAWALHELSRHREADAALAQEVDRVLDDGRAPVIDDVGRLAFASAVVAETLRLYPAGYVTAREAISEVDIGGHRLAKGTLVLMSQWAMQRREDVFVGSDDFRPERWLEGLATSLERGDYFPFGMGPRQCIGMAFANLELVLALAAIRRRARLEPSSIEPVRPVPKVALNPDRPINLRVQEAGQKDAISRSASASRCTRVRGRERRRSRARPGGA